MSLRCLGPSVTVQQVTFRYVACEAPKSGRTQNTNFPGIQKEGIQSTNQPKPPIYHWLNKRIFKEILLMVQKSGDHHLGWCQNPLPSTVSWVWLPVTMTKITAIHMEPAKHQFRKENDLPNLHDDVPAVNLQGCITCFFCVWIPDFVDPPFATENAILAINNQTWHKYMLITRIYQPIFF